MNQGIYRLLFNAAKGLWVVVGEIAKSRQKTGRRSLKRTQQTPVKATLSPLRCALLFAFGHIVFSTPLWADIIADTSAPGNQQATILSTANGTTQVNIQTPSAGGVSRNQFSQFDVDAQGVILNNSRVNTSTQLGGFVGANPYLVTGSAAVLLMEVNSTNPSLLNGYMEVAGSRADIIFANPAGISCSGCGFINANKTVLTTGDVILNGNNIDSYRVTDGVISINGDGLDATDSNFTHLISRSVEVNAGIWAQDLQVTTGTNQVAASGASVTELSSGAGQPNFAIDVSALGGMYANVIRLVGTEDGVGVRNAGEIGASVGEFTLSIDGRLENTNRIVSEGRTTLLTTADIDNTGGTIHSNTDISITADNLHNTNGAITALSDITITAGGDIDNRKGEINTNTQLTIAATNIDNREGLLHSEDALTLNVDGGTLHNDEGFIESSGAVDITAAQINNTLTWRSTVLVDGNDDPILDVNDNLQYVRIKGIVGDTVTIDAEAIDNADGQIAAVTSTSINVSGVLTNQGLISSDGDTTITAETLNNNEAGVIYGGDTVTATTTTLTNTSSIIGGSVHLTATNKISNIGPDALIGATDENGTLILLAPVIENSDDVTTGDDDKPTTTILGLGDVIIAGAEDGSGGYTAATSVLNQSAFIGSEGDMRIIADTITNTRRVLQTTDTYNADGKTVSGYVVWTAANPNVPGGRYIEPPHGGSQNSDYIRTEYTGTTFRNSVTQNSPRGIIEVGGDFTPEATSLNNYWSDITVAGNMVLGSTALDQDSWTNGNNGQGTTPYAESATYQGKYWYRTYKSEDWYHTWEQSTPTITPITGYDSTLNVGGTLSGNGVDINNGGSSTGSIITGTPATRVTRNSNLFDENADPDATYLVETNPLFTNNRLWLSSAFVTDQVAQSPDVTNKRLGDGFYEQRLVRDQITALTGNRFLGNYSNNETQYLDLLNSGVSYAQTYNLRPGIALSEDQIASLTDDIVWLEAQEIVLADGSTQQVLAPKVYLRPSSLVPTSAGSLIAANNIQLTNVNTFINGGTMTAKDGLSVQGVEINNRGGRLQSGGQMALTSTQNIDLTSAQISAGELSIDAGNQLILTTGSQSTQYTLQGGTRTQTQLGETASIEVTGDASITTGDDFIQKGAELTVGGNLTADIGNDWKISGAKEIETTRTNNNGGHANTDSTRHLASQITVGGTTTIDVDQDLTIAGANLTLGGDAQINAGRDITLTTLTDIAELDATSASGDHNESRQSKSESIISTVLNSDGNLTLNAGRNLTSEGSIVSAEQDLALAAQGDISLASAQEENYSFAEHSAKKSFGRKESSLKESFTTTNVGGEFSAGNNLTINSAINNDGSVQAYIAGNVDIHGGNLTAENQVAIAGDSVTIADKKEVTFTREETFKRGWGGLSKKSTGKINRDELIQASELVANQRNLDLISASDIAIIGSNLRSGEDINLTAVDDIVITADRALAQAQEWSKETKFLSSMSSVYSREDKLSGSTTATVVASEINAGNNVTINAGRARVVGSDILAGNDVNVTTDIGDIVVESAQSTSESYSNETTVKVSMSDIIEQATDVDALADSFSDGQATMSLAKVTYDKIDTQTTATAHRASQLLANNNVSFDSVGDIAITGSDIIADADNNQQGDANLIAGGDVTIKETADISDTEIDEVHGKGEISFVVQHQAIEIVKAAKAVKEARDQVKTAKEDYRKYKKDLEFLKVQRDQLQTDYNNKVPGLLYEDIIDLNSLIDEVESDKEWYQAGIALAAISLASKVTLLVQQTVAGAASVVTFGFNAGVQIDLEASKTETDTHSEVSRGSVLAGNNINIQTGNNGDVTQTATQITGSHLQASEDITIATGELTVEASRDENSFNTKNEQASIRIAQTVYGTVAGGPTVSASYSRSKAKSGDTTYNNSTLNADNITLSSTGDTTIKGANIKAEDTLTLNVGEDLIVQSKQNRYNANNKSFGISAGFSLGKAEGKSDIEGGTVDNQGGTVDSQKQNLDSTTFAGAANNLGQSNGQVSSVSGGLNASSGRSRTKQTVLTDLIGETVNITVGKNTALIGATIAAKDADGSDNGQLSLTTDTFDFGDLSNTSYDSQRSAGFSTSVGIPSSDPTQNEAKDAKGKDDLKLNTTNIAYSNSSSYSKSKTLATLGEGAVTITDDQASGDDSTERLNRDTDNTTKDLYSIDRQQGNVDLTIDTRLLTEDGRKQIKEDIKRTELLIEAVGDAATKDSVQLGDLRQHILDLQKELDVQEKLARQEGGIHAQTLDNPTATPTETQAALTAYAEVYSETFGISIEKAMVVAVNSINSRGEMVAGIHYMNDGKSVIVINDNAQANGSSYTNTLGHEVTHAQIAQNGTRNRDANDPDGQLNEEYAHLRGDYAEDLYGFSFSQNDLGDVNTGDTNLHVGNQGSVLASTNLQQIIKDDPKVVDSWSPLAHDKITEHALSGKISQSDLAIIKLAGRRFDEETQAPNYSHLHSLAEGGKKTPEEAIKLRDEFIENTLNNAKKYAEEGYRDLALKLFAEAIHPIMDSSSPAHKKSGSEEVKSWYGLISGTGGNLIGWLSGLTGHSPNEHFGSETASDLTKEILESQKILIQNAYKEVFGE
ncbi:MAG: filamentous hemagglutinin [Candidatus Endobugula sp.]|jgi:filamentous hemagglutinin